MSATLYKCLIEEISGTKPFFQLYWAFGQHLGGALERMRDAAVINGLKRPRCSQADPFDFAGLPPAVEWSQDRNVMWDPTRNCFPPEPVFAIPYGVIASFREGEFDADDIRPGFNVTFQRGLHTVEANVEEGYLLAEFAALLHEFEPLQVFWIKIHDHWDDHPADLIYVNEKLNTADVIDRLLRGDTVNTARNGFLTLTGYHPDGETNINISDHKKIIVLTRSAAVANRAIAWLTSRNYHRLEPFISIDNQVPHWHYRDPTSLSREALVEALRVRGFRQWTPSQTES